MFPSKMPWGGKIIKILACGFIAGRFALTMTTRTVQVLVFIQEHEKLKYTHTQMISLIIAESHDSQAEL